MHVLLFRADRSRRPHPGDQLALHRGRAGLLRQAKRAARPQSPRRNLPLLEQPLVPSVSCAE
jgi:hypothetical protein